jgi:hypothetical protein
MRYIRIIAMPALLLLLAPLIGAVGTTSALAASTGNPQWSLCVKKAGGKFTAGCESAGGEFATEALAAGETREMKGTAGEAQELQVAGGAVVAKKLKFAHGAAMRGSNQPNPGETEETIEYEELSVPGFPACKVEQSKTVVTALKTRALKDKLAFQTKAGAEKEEGPIVTVLKPASGNLIIEFELVGAGEKTCPSEGLQKVEGAIVLEDLEGEKYKEAHSFKGPAGPIAAYFVNEGGVTVEKTAELTDNGAKKAWVFVIVIVVVLVYADRAQ